MPENLHDALPELTLEEIARLVGSSTLVAGRTYRAQGRVGPIRWASDRQSIQATVQGSKRAPYAQSIRLGATGADGRYVLATSCSCPMRRNCKHVAAVLLACQAEAPARPKALAPPSQPVEPNLPPEVEAWLRGLEAAQESESDDYPPNVRRRLLYVLDRGKHTGAPIVSLVTIDLGRDGSVSGSGRSVTVHQFRDEHHLPKFIRPADRPILAELSRAGMRDAGEMSDIIKRIVATGRGRWGSWDGPELSEGPPVAGTIAWTLSDDGLQRATLELPDSLLPLKLARPWYVDPATGVIGLVETDVPPRVLGALLSGPPVVPAIAARVRGEIQRRLPKAAFPPPSEPPPTEFIRETPRPRLALFAGQLPNEMPYSVASRYQAQREASTVPLARLSFTYGPVTLATPVNRDTVVQEGKLLTVVRKPAVEARAWERLHELGLQVVQRLGVVHGGHRHANDLMLTDPDPSSWIDFVLHDLPALRDDGWDIIIGDDFPVRLAEPDGDIEISIDESSGIDWFDIELGVMVDGERINLVPVLRGLLANADFMASLSDDNAMPAVLPLPDGRLLKLPMARLRPILAPLLELFLDDEDGDGLRLPRNRVADLALLEDAGGGLAWSGGEALRALGRQLRAAGGIPPCAVPEGFGANLRPYQAQGLAWLQLLASAGLGGVLADDMGLGKTVQTLAHIAVEHAAGRLDRPALVICPTSVVPTWSGEAARFAPALRVLVLHGPDRARDFDSLDQNDLVITSYPLLMRDHEVLARQPWHIVVLDEAQTIKNPLATTSKVARTLNSRHRLGLSGTPLENHLGELWSLFDFIMPGFLGNRQQFGRRYRAPIEKSGNSALQAQLARRVAPFLLRRTKAEVAGDLPPRTLIAETVEMEPPQRALYDAIRMAMHKRVRKVIAERGLARSGIIILDALLKLRQACCDPRLLKLTTAKAANAGSAKLDRLFEMLPEMLEEGRRILLFSQFTSMLALIEAELKARKMPYLLLTGETKDRAGLVKRFQNCEVPLFLISLKAGGVGLTLTAADTVIHYDPWWNPAVEDQATDRAHRIGQEKSVFVHKLITLGTIEEKMETLKAKKQALVDGILGAGNGATLGMTEADVDALFAA